MIIAHLPAGYLAGRFVPKAWGTACVAGVLVGSVLPDIDFLWLALVDDWQGSHHAYLTHRPFVWMLIATIATLFWSYRPARWLTGVGLGALLHLLLDSIAGQIAWAWPVSDATHKLVTIPMRHDFWPLSIITHWLFLVELAICFAALAAFVVGRRSSRTGRPRNRPLQLSEGS